MSDDSQKKLQTGDDLALDALSEAGQETPALPTGLEVDVADGDDEIAKSNQVAATLNSLQGLIERHAEHLQTIAHEMKGKRESLKNVFENDSQLSEAQEVAKEQTVKVKERRSALGSDPQVTSLKVQIGELNQQKKEIEETLSNHLVSYYSMTNSTSFDTSDGDQWEFSIKAKVRARKK
jgi:chromosome segregation ATPase